MYVILKGNKYVARSGSEHSYTADLAYAQVYKNYADAKRNCCGNERVEHLLDLLGVK